MKGLELSRQYYDEILCPFLETELPERVDRIAAGLVGDGSECFGYDDDLSRDHDWGVRVCLWVNHKDLLTFGGELSSALRKLPGEFHGFSVILEPDRGGVVEIGAFFRKYLRKEIAPETVGEWLSIPDAYLAAASNGAVFADPLGEFSSVWKELRRGYPGDIRLKKLARRCMSMGQAGQYNFPRLMKRGDPVAAQLALDEFIRAAISAVYLLNHRYAPFYKWMYRGLQELETAGKEISALMEQLIATNDRQGVIEQICRTLISEFHRQGISDEGDAYMVAQGESIHAHICMDALRNTDPWMECP